MGVLYGIQHGSPKVRPKVMEHKIYMKYMELLLCLKLRKFSYSHKQNAVLFRKMMKEVTVEEMLVKMTSTMMDTAWMQMTMLMRYMNQVNTCICV